MTKQWLDINNYSYNETVLDDPHIIQGFYEKHDEKFNSLPQIFIDGTHIGGFDQLLRSSLV